MTQSTDKHELLFQNAVFNEGLNVTCRRGDKWHNRFKSGVTDVIIKETDSDDDMGDARIVGCELINWSNSDDVRKLVGWLHFEHDPSCRTIDGIKIEMHRVYGEGWDSEPMTVVFFV